MNEIIKEWFFDELTGINSYFEDYDDFVGKPAKIYVCKCEQCKAVKAKRKNRKNKKIIKRYLNKLRRNDIDSYKNYCWA